MRGARTGRLAVVGCFLALAVAGCGPSEPQFSGAIEYRNRSADELYVSSLTGFRREVQCGVLSSGSLAESHMGQMGYPRQTTITWRVKDGPAKSEVLDLDAALKNDPNMGLFLEYTRDGKWNVTAKPYK